MQVGWQIHLFVWPRQISFEKVLHISLSVTIPLELFLRFVDLTNDCVRQVTCEQVFDLKITLARVLQSPFCNQLLHFLLSFSLLHLHLLND